MPSALPALRLAAGALLLALAPSAHALTVVSATPANNTAALPAQTTLTLTFSEVVADPALVPPALVVFPLGEVTVGPATRSADGRTLVVPLVLPADARVVVLLLGAAAESGATLARPFALNLSTQPSAGTLTVRGSVTGAGGLAPDGSIVALLTGDLATGAVQIVAAAVVSGSASSLPYAVGPVPLSLYTAGALRLPLPLGAGGSFGLGFYDPDGDGVPNPIFFPTGVNITVAPPAPQTARTGFEDVRSAAEGSLGAGARLVEIPAQAVSPEGLAPTWLYRFEAAADPAAEAVVLRLGPLVLPVSVPDGPTGAALPVPFADSDAVLAAAEAAGGAAFRARFPPDAVAVTAGVEASPAPAWEVVYAAPGESLRVRVNVATGVSAAGRPPAAGLALRLAGANPGRGPLVAVLALDAPAAVRVSVVDALGRTVAVLAEGAHGAGTHTLRWQAAAPGAYRVVAEAAGVRAVLPTVRL